MEVLAFRGCKDSESPWAASQFTFESMRSVIRNEKNSFLFFSAHMCIGRERDCPSDKEGVKKPHICLFLI